jgi:hypothetical protein
VKLSNLLAPVCLALFTVASNAQAGVMVSQYASSVTGFSSQYDEEDGSADWWAVQALGAPDTVDYGDEITAWAPLPKNGPWNGPLEFITVEFLTPVFANQVTIRESWGAGFVRQLDVVDSNDSLQTVWTGVDPSVPGNPKEPVDFTIDFAQTEFLVKGVKVYVDTRHNLDEWEEIDSIQLVGSTSASSVPEPASLAVLGIGALGVVVRHRRNQKHTLRRDQF